MFASEKASGSRRTSGSTCHDSRIVEPVRDAGGTVVSFFAARLNALTAGIARL